MLICSSIPPPSEGPFYRLAGRQLFKGSRRHRKPDTVVLPPVFADELSRLPNQLVEYRRHFGVEYQSLDLIFCEANGKLLHVHNIVRRDFRPLLKRAGLPPIGFHDLRHAHATLLLQQGTHPKIVQERLGHAGIGITLDIYSHVVPGMQEQAVAELQSRLFAAMDEKL